MKGILGKVAALDGRDHEREHCVGVGFLVLAGSLGGVLLEPSLVNEILSLLVMLWSAHRHRCSVPPSRRAWDACPCGSLTDLAL